MSTFVKKPAVLLLYENSNCSILKPKSLLLAPVPISRLSVYFKYPFIILKLSELIKVSVIKSPAKSIY